MIRCPFILALSLLACPPIAAQRSGLLLGYWDETGQRHRTLWIHHSGDTAATQVIPGLFIPRKTGLWHLGNYFTLSTEDQSDERHIWAVPADRRPVIVLHPMRGW